MTLHRWGKYKKNVKFVGKIVSQFNIMDARHQPNYRAYFSTKIENGQYITYFGENSRKTKISGKKNISGGYLRANNIFSSNKLLTSPSDFYSFEIESPGRYEYTLIQSSRNYGDEEEQYMSVVIREVGNTEEFKEYSRGLKLGTVTSTDRGRYPDNGYSGDYWYVYEGISNQAPTISGKDEDLGGFKTPFKKVFSVDDPDGNETLNVTVKLNSATIRTINNATKQESYEIDIDKAKFDELELNKENTIEITVSDSNGASAIRRYTFKKVNSNPIVTVTNSNMGEQNKPFNFSFKAADPDGDDITVKVYVDDVQIEDLGQVTPNQAKTVSIGKLDYAKLKNGEHRIKIEATDSFGAKGTGYIVFTKKIDYCWYRLTKEVDAQPTAIVVNPLAEVAKGAKMTIKVSLNAMDANPTWEIVPEELIGQKYNFTTKTKTANNWCIGVDIRIDRANTPDGMESYFYGFVGAYM